LLLVDEAADHENGEANDEHKPPEPAPAMAAINPSITRSAPIASHRQPALTTRTGMLSTVTRASAAARSGVPQLGQVAALSETSFSHYEHLISAIISPVPSNEVYTECFGLIPLWTWKLDTKCAAPRLAKSGIEIQSGKEGFGAAPAQHGAQHQRAVIRNEVKVLTKSRLTTRIGLRAPSFDCGVPSAFAIKLRRGGRQLGMTRKVD